MIQIQIQGEVRSNKSLFFIFITVITRPDKLNDKYIYNKRSFAFLCGEPIRNKNNKIHSTLDTQNKQGEGEGFAFESPKNILYRCATFTFRTPHFSVSAAAKVPSSILQSARGRTPKLRLRACHLYSSSSSSFS